MNMRETFVKTTKEFIEKDDRVALILAGISVAGFNDEIAKYPQRVFDAGISEQANLSIAAGMSVTGMIPIFHSFAPFICERAYEQLKIDFGYQKLRGNFISNGSSIDCSSFGATHQCPAEIGVLKQIPNIEIIVPGTAEEFDTLYRATYSNDNPTYISMSRDQNPSSQTVEFGKANVIKKGSKLTVIAVGNMLRLVNEAVKDLDVTVLYYTTLAPFDTNALVKNCASNKVLLCEPYYQGGLLYDVVISLNNKCKVDMIGIPHIFMKHYGMTPDCYRSMGVSIEDIRQKAIKMIQDRK